MKAFKEIIAAIAGAQAEIGIAKAGLEQMKEAMEGIKEVDKKILKLIDERWKL